MPTAERLARKAAALTPKQKLLIDWLTQPDTINGPSTLGEWCKANQVHTRTAAYWKTDIKFREAWDKRLHELRIDPDRVDEVIEAMRQKALKGSEKAAQIWLEIASRFMPTHQPETVDDDLGSLSDAELEALIGESAATELARRSGDDG